MVSAETVTKIAKVMIGYYGTPELAELHALRNASGWIVDSDDNTFWLGIAEYIRQVNPPPGFVK